jgi:peptidoglycan DL-endopeptidase CwlO
LTGSVRRLSRLSTASFAAIGAIAIVTTQSIGPAMAVEPASAVESTSSIDSTVVAPLIATEPAVGSDPAVAADPVDPALIDPSIPMDPATIVPAAVPAPVPAALVAPASVAPARTVATRMSAVTAVIKAARSHLGARYRHGATGPYSFDCSGLVYRAFAQAGLARRIDSLHSARALYAYFRRHHLASRGSPQVGDLVIWGHGAHVGIYIGGGRAISALVSGVRVHPVGAVLSGFTAYLHTHLRGLTVPIPHGTTSHHTAAPHHAVRKATTSLAVRTGPGVSHHRIAIVRRGTRLVVLASRLSGGRRWYHVRLPNGRTGWVAGWDTRA